MSIIPVKDGEDVQRKKMEKPPRLTRRQIRERNAVQKQHERGARRYLILIISRKDLADGTYSAILKGKGFSPFKEHKRVEPFDQARISEDTVSLAWEKRLDPDSGYPRLHLIVEECTAIYPNDSLLRFKMSLHMDGGRHSVAQTPQGARRVGKTRRRILAAFNRKISLPPLGCV